MIPQTGDVIFSNGTILLNKLTAYYTRARGEEKTLATHQAMARDEVNTVHATRVGVVRIPWKEYLARSHDHGAEIAVLRRVKPYTDYEIIVIREMLDEMSGYLPGTRKWKYSALELGLQLVDGRINKILPESIRKRMPGAVSMGSHHEVVWARRLGDVMAHDVICSRTANRVLIRMGDLPPILRHGNPDDTWDCLVSKNRLHNIEWEMVFRTDGWGGHVDRIMTARCGAAKAAVGRR